MESIIKRLNVLIHIELKRMATEGMLSRDQISTLSSLGLNYNEIAAIIGRTPSYVASELTVLKKRKR